MRHPENFDEIKDGLYRVSTKTSITRTRQDWAQPILSNMELIEYDLTRVTHQVSLMETLRQLSGAIYARGLDKVGRMSMIVKDSRGIFISYQNGQYLTIVYDSETTHAMFTLADPTAKHNVN